MQESLQHQILKNENRYWDAMRANDVEAAIALTHFPCLVASPHGTRSVTQEDYRSLMEASDGDRFKGITIDNPDVQAMTDDSAIITYTVEMNGMTMRDTSLWLKEGGKWTCGYHAEFPEMAQKQ